MRGGLVALGTALVMVVGGSPSMSFNGTTGKMTATTQCGHEYHPGICFLPY